MGQRLFASKCLHWVHGGHLAGWDITSHHDRRTVTALDAMYVRGSSDVTPKSREEIHLDRPPANASPMMPPTQLRISPFRTNNHLSALGSAPRTRRMPTSRRRCPTA
jgi:hypothetical protein